MTDGSGDAPQRDEVLARLDALSSEAQALEGDVRAAVDRLRAGLARVRDEVEALGGAEVDGAQHASHAVGADIDGARLTALDLVLRDTPRDQARSLISGQFPGVDVDALLDELGA